MMLKISQWKKETGHQFQFKKCKWIQKIQMDLKNVQKM